MELTLTTRPTTLLHQTCFEIAAPIGSLPMLAEARRLGCRLLARAFDLFR